MKTGRRGKGHRETCDKETRDVMRGRSREKRGGSISSSDLYLKKSTRNKQNFEHKCKIN